MGLKTRRDRLIQDLKEDLDILIASRDRLFDLTARKAIGKAIETVQASLDYVQDGLPLPPAVSRLKFTKGDDYEKVDVTLTGSSAWDSLGIELRLNRDTSAALAVSIGTSSGKKHAYLNIKREDLTFLAELLSAAVSASDDLEGYIGQYRERT